MTSLPQTLSKHSTLCASSLCVLLPCTRQLLLIGSVACPPPGPRLVSVTFMHLCTRILWSVDPPPIAGTRLLCPVLCHYGSAISLHWHGSHLRFHRHRLCLLQFPHPAHFTISSHRPHPVHLHAHFHFPSIPSLSLPLLPSPPHSLSGPPKQLDEDEVEFLSAVDSVSGESTGKHRRKNLG